jgi:hypothetical protein
MKSLMAEIDEIVEALPGPTVISSFPECNWALKRDARRFRPEVLTKVENDVLV